MRQFVLCACIALAGVCANAADLFRCGEPYARSEEVPHASSADAVEIKEMTPAEFHSKFAGAAKQTVRFAPAAGITSVVAHVVVERDEDAPSDMRLWLETIGLEVRRESGRAFYLLDEAESETRPHSDSRPTPVRVAHAATEHDALIAVRFATSWSGAHASGTEHNTLVIDLRSRAPRLVRLTCNEYWMGGACSAYDEVYSPRDTMRCVWSKADHDFTCTQRRSLATGWTTRESLRRFELLTSKGRLAPEHESTMRSLEEAARMIANRRPTNITINELGTLRQFHSTAEGKILFYAMPSTGLEMSLRLFAADLRAAAPTLQEVAVAEVPDRERPERHSAHRDAGIEYQADNAPALVPRARFTLTGPAFSILRATSLGGAPSDFFRVDVADGPERALFLVAVDADAVPAKVAAMRLASTAMEHGECSSLTQPSSISSIAWNAVNARFDVTIEPHVEGSEQEDELDYGAGCSRRGTLSWSRADGFRLDQSPDCAGPRRVVSIAEDGTLAASVPPAK